MKSLKEIRQYLHQNPELSENEIQTASFLEKEIQILNPDEVLKIAHSRIFIFDSGKPGLHIAFRADMDALPIEEENTIKYVSQKKGVAHVCGHDGHMSILIGFARELVKNPPQKGKVILVFQSAEETGQGAKQLMESEEFLNLKIDFIFGLHNIPGIERGEILVKNGTFASASRGMILKIQGKTSHAAEPEKGINPAVAVAQITQELDQIVKTKGLFKDFTLLTFIYIKMGEVAFGTSAGHAEMGFTIRSYENEDIDHIIKWSKDVISDICFKHKLKCSFEFTEVFPATITIPESYQRIKKAAEKLKLSVKELEEPMKWSEDFGYYSSHIKTGFFGLGSGVDQPKLHNPDFNFPDEIIDAGISVFLEILKSFG